MTKESEKQTSSNKPSKMELEQAVRIVNEAIRQEEQRYSKIANSSEDQEPIMIEGCTTASYYCQLMVDPKALARTLLDYNYPTWKILGAEAPDGMWEELGKMYGLESVCSMDL